MNRPGTGYGQPVSQGKGTANWDLSLVGAVCREGTCKRSH